MLTRLNNPPSGTLPNGEDITRWMMIDDTGMIRSGAEAVAEESLCIPIGWEDQFHITSPVWRQATEKGRVGGTSQTENYS